MFEKRDEWYQHEMESHRIEWICGQTGHPSYTDQAAFLRHMSADHNADVGAAQSTAFSNIFERPSRSQKGTCCLCLREARNLKTHLAHHLEQIALFSLPRKSEVPEMDSGANMRGTAQTISENTASDSGIEPPGQQDRESLQDSNELSHLGKGDNDQHISSIDQIPIPESDPGDTSFSWTEVYQKLADPEEVTDQRQTELLALAAKLVLRPGMDKIHLNLTHTGRDIIIRGDLQRFSSVKLGWIDCHAVLFDHYLVLAKTIEKPDRPGGLSSEKFDVSKVPIPMDLLSLESRDDERIVKNKGDDRDSSDKVLYPFRIRHLGQIGDYVLCAPTWEKRNEWCEKIIQAKTRSAASHRKQNIEPFQLRVLSDMAFTYDNESAPGKTILIRGTPLDRAIQDAKNTFEPARSSFIAVFAAAINCATAFNHPNGTHMVAVGTDRGVYISDYKKPREWSWVGSLIFQTLCFAHIK